MLARLSRWTLPTLILVVSLIVYRQVFLDSTPEALELPRAEPWLIAPRHDEPRMVTDDQLRDILARLQPRFASNATPVNSNDWVHALRLWGRQATFDDPAAVPGATMLRFFLDDAVYRRFAGSQAPPLLEMKPDSVRIRSYDDDFASRTTSSYHQDDILATLAETGVPLDTPLAGRHGQARVSDLLESSLRRFHPEQYEYEWTAISYARYAFPLDSWTNRYGERIDVEKLVDELLAAPLPVGPCNGLHRLEAVVLLSRVDEEAGGVLRPALRQRLLDHMGRVSGLLARSQHRDGYWTRAWPQGEEAAAQTGRDVGERLLVTGHHLEWLSLAPPEVLPPRETLVRAGQWLARAMLEMDESELRERYGPFSHGARALSYWRGQEPFAAWQRLTERTSPDPAGGP